MTIYPSFEALKRRCAEAGLKIVEEADLDPAQYPPALEEDELVPWVEIAFPRGRRERVVEVAEVDTAEWFLETPFERYRYLEGFEASWSPEDGVVECNLKEGLTNSLLLSEEEGSSRDGSLFNRGWHFNNLLTTLGIEIASPHDPDLRLEVPSRTDLTISLGPSSDVHSMLSHSFDTAYLGAEGGVTRTLTLRIERARVETHDDAAELLERVGNAVLFQLDLSLGVPLILERERWGARVSNPWVTAAKGRAGELSPVRFEYDREPMSLYWYAKTASPMPLLRFLAFYQVLEFYFPVYSEAEAQRTLKNVLKDPTFDPTRDADVSRLLEAVKVGSRGRAFGNELEQLEATIRHCVSADDMRGYLIPEDEDRYAFYTSDDAKKVVREALPLRRESDDHRGSVAKRIYAIRNRVVHTKGAHSDQAPLFPFDPETKHLDHDIGLAEFLAKKALIASSGALRA